MKQETQHYNYDWKSVITVGTVYCGGLLYKHQTSKLSIIQTAYGRVVNRKPWATFKIKLSFD